MNLLDNNIDVLSQSSNHWIGEPQENDISLEVFDDCEEGNEKLFLNDRILIIKDELDETSLPNPLKKELIFLVGILSVNEIMKYIRTMSQESILIIVEPNIPFFNYALNKKDLYFFKLPNVILFADGLSKLPLFLDRLFSTSALFYLKNIKFYFTYYYRQHDLDMCISIVKEIKNTAKYKAMIYGNSVDDSLLGFKQNMQNLKHLTRSKDVSHLKNQFENIPAIVVSAGPSLNKNIKHLKKIKTSAVIIAVDTIAQRLCDEGIIPDFICSIERGEVVYSYFYKNKRFPADIPIVAPLLLYPKIFDEHDGDIIIPMRSGVGEYSWLQQILGLSDDASISIGISCAHVAFGFAAHIGASPIVLVGQDLAFGSSVSETHAVGTIYDNTKSANEEASSKKEVYTEGYLGTDVATTDLWNSFRTWFEFEISEKKLNVINATEGGARIANTTQMNLENVINRYCSKSVTPVKKIMQNTDTYPLDKSEMKLILEEQHSIFKDMVSQFEQQVKVIKRISLTSHSSEKELMKALSKLERTDSLFSQITGNTLLKHNLQPVMISCVWDLYAIEQTLTATNLMKNRAVQLDFLTVCVVVLTEIVSILQKTLVSF